MFWDTSFQWGDTTEGDEGGSRGCLDVCIDTIVNRG